MYKNFPNTHYQLDGSKYFLDNTKNILESDNVNLRELHYNLEAFYFFIKAVGSTFHQEVKNIKQKYKAMRNKANKEKLCALVKEYKEIIDRDKAINLLFQKRHESKSRRIGPEITFSVVEKIENKTVSYGMSFLISPTTGKVLEMLEVGRIQNIRFKDWEGNESAIELCTQVYGRIEINAINAILDINNMIEG
ncbi:MAG: hypothetical protein IH964_07800 [Candidatus Dadabacteria bacterium]|nr:hypothetical protein [Candidatus Dadabacteria bacterium]